MDPKTDKPTCETCRFYVVGDGGERRGECRRFPPQVSNTEHAFPRSFRGAWCGEHQPGEPRVAHKVKPARA